MPDVITSRDNRWLKQFRAALRGTGPRDGEAIGVEGPKLIEEALRSGLEAEALLVSADGERAVAKIFRAAGASDAGIPSSFSQASREPNRRRGWRHFSSSARGNSTMCCAVRGSCVRLRRS